MFLYSLAKKLDGIPGPGTTKWWAHRVSKGYGVCEEKFFPSGSVRSESDVPKLTISAEAYRNARTHRWVFAYQRLYSVNDLKRILVGRPCQPPPLPSVCFDMFDGIYEAPGGYVSLPNNDQHRINRHCVTVVGYNDADKVLRFMNSWGPDWGDEGTGYLPYEYFNRGLVPESWAWFPITLCSRFRSLHVNRVFRDSTGERVRVWVSSIPPPAWGRPMLWVIDLHDREGALLGWAHASVYVNCDVTEIEELFVKPGYRRRGLATVLIKQIIRIADYCITPITRAWIPNQDIFTPDRLNTVRSFFRSVGFSVTWDGRRYSDFYSYKAERAITKR